MKCKNKEVKVKGYIYLDLLRKMKETELTCIITNDEKGKTLSIHNEGIMFTIPFEPIEQYLSKS